MNELSAKFFASKSSKNGLWLIAAVFIPVFYACLVSFRGMPPSEGWYHYWSYLMNEQGMAPYRDFQFLFPPLYINFIALFAKIFGYNIISYRILGVIIFGFISFGLYLNFSLLFGKRIAFVCTVAACLYMQSEVAQIFYDYVRVMDFISIFAVYFLLQALKSEFSQKRFLFLNGLFAALFVITKQNSGVIFFAFDIIALLFSMLYFRTTVSEIFKNFVLMLLPAFFVFACTAIYLLSIDSLSLFLGSVTGDAATAKGGVKVALFNWIINGMPAFKSNWFFASSILFFWLMLLVGMKIHGTEQEHESHSFIFPYILFFAFVFLALVGFSLSENLALKLRDCYSYQLAPYFYFDIVFPLFAALAFYFCQRIFKSDERKASFWYLLFAASGASFAIYYGCGTSGGLSEGQSYLAVGLSVGLTLYLFERFSGTEMFILVLKRSCAVFCVVVAALFALASADRKMFTLYYWWGTQESSYWQSNEKTDRIPLLKGISLSPETKELYEGIYELVQANTQKGDAVFCFPMIPIFYQILDRADPGVYTKVDWFDFCSEQSVRNDIKILRKNKPSAIVMFNLKDFVYEGHEKGFYGGGGISNKYNEIFFAGFC